MSAYRKLFGTCPFENRLSELERLRKLRNNAGHTFGRDIEMMRFARSSLVEPLQKISDEDVQDNLALVEIVAESIEAPWAATYVGHYEIVKLLHLWLNDLTGPRSETKVLAQRFSTHVRRVTLLTYGKQAGVRLLGYYNAL